MTEFWHCDEEDCTKEAKYQYKHGFYCNTHYIYRMWEREWYPEDIREKVYTAKRIRNMNENFGKKIDRKQKYGYLGYEIGEEPSPIAISAMIVESQERFFMMADLFGNRNKE